ncbi:MAG: NosD domain-containing protein [Candidatus Kariarchaeaceae archaeon]|jgi:parallel beta-helix repeat protein
MIIGIEGIGFFSQSISDYSNSIKEANPKSELKKDKGFYHNEVAVQSYLFHTPIQIYGNSHFREQAIAEGWDLGGSRDGSPERPYVIKGYNITPPGSPLIGFANTDYHFIITDNVITGNIIGSQGINLENVTNAVISNNIISNNTDEAIRLASSSSNITIHNNTIYNNNNGIYVHALTNSNTISQNTIFNSSNVGFTLDSSTNNKILGNAIFGNNKGIV